MSVEVLLSCMYKKDNSIIYESNLANVHTLVINQCNIDEDVIQEDHNKLHRVYLTKTRGLSVSRNLAIDNSEADICVLSDDDEVFVDDLEKIVESAYCENPTADIIIFNLENRHQKLGNKKKRLRGLDLLRVASWQITFRRESVCNKVRFDEKLGAGTGNGGGEENKFLFDCEKAGLQILYMPIIIATGIEDLGSTWFFGYDANYFYKLGAVLRYILGSAMGGVYCLYTVVTKRNLYKKDISLCKAFVKIAQGYFGGKLE